MSEEEKFGCGDEKKTAANKDIIDISCDDVLDVMKEKIHSLEERFKICVRLGENNDKRWKTVMYFVYIMAASNLGFMVMNFFGK